MKLNFMDNFYSDEKIPNQTPFNMNKSFDLQKIKTNIYEFAKNANNE